MATAGGTPATVRAATSANSTGPMPPGVGIAEPAALAVRKTTATAEKLIAPPKACTEASRQAVKLMVSSRMPPKPVNSLVGVCIRSSIRGTTPKNSERTRVTTKRRSGPTAATTRASTAAVSTPMITAREALRSPLVWLPVIRPKLNSSSRCPARPASCEAPTLATAWPGRMPAFCR